jgi:hypothetical protein
MIPVMYTKAATTPFHEVVDGDKYDLKFEINMGAAKQNAKK